MVTGSSVVALMVMRCEERKSEILTCVTSKYHLLQEARQGTADYLSSKKIGGNNVGCTRDDDQAPRGLMDALRPRINSGGGLRQAALMAGLEETNARIGVRTLVPWQVEDNVACRSQARAGGQNGSRFEMV